MGTCCAPAYANLYLGGWERYIFSDDELSMYTDQVMCCMCYIDDVFLIWTGTHAMLIAFVEMLNLNSFNLRFTLNVNAQRITFLDLSIFKDEDNCLATSLYRKETAGITLLHAASAHPAALIRSIPYAQYIRLRRNCTHIVDFIAEAKLLHTHLLARGYSKSLLRKAYNKALKQSRNALLYPKKDPISETKPTLRIITWF